jgi:phosphomannomutase
MAGIALILQYLSGRGISLSDVVGELPGYFIVKEKFEFRGDFDKIAEIAGNTFKGEINTLDGIRIDMDKGWVHLRMSNTEPVLRVIAEAASEQEAQDIVDKAGKITG